MTSNLQALRLFGLTLLTCTFVACGSLPDGERPTNALFCDSYLMYPMCASDLDEDGIVELVYFEDTKEVFMYRPGAESNIPAELGTHRCMRAMDEQLVGITSRVFYVDESTSFLERQDIRGAMLLKYISYMPEITACNMRAERAEREAAQQQSQTAEAGQSDSPSDS